MPKVLGFLRGACLFLVKPGLVFMAAVDRSAAVQQAREDA